MKTVSLTIVLMLACFAQLFAQDKSEFKNAMGATLSEMNTIKDNGAYLDLSNKFQRISEAEPTEWLPAYYSALCTTLYSFGEKDKTKVDLLLDQAQTILDKGLKIKAGESELWVLQGMLFQARIMVDPMARGQNFSMKANEAFEKAESLNPENPRIYFLKGQSVMNMPKMFGGGKEAAKPIFEKAKTKFENFKPTNEIYPNWGKDMNEKILASCN
ncbi:MAG: hypothetical protein HXX14_02435 [Bacteroidetes bacterium]|nr:hypothetical protein [Bacteroidota bacterium]